MTNIHATLHAYKAEARASSHVEVRQDPLSAQPRLAQGARQRLVSKVGWCRALVRCSGPLAIGAGPRCTLRQWAVSYPQHMGGRASQQSGLHRRSR
jgi:hypothetical protein